MLNAMTISHTTTTLYTLLDTEKVQMQSSMEKHGSQTSMKERSLPVTQYQNEKDPHFE